ncbi:MAG: hypothetical protein AAFU79_15440 [Myxococcota bacterium]
MHHGSDLGHIEVDRVVIVAAAARRSARASIRPLRMSREAGSGQKPTVLRDGRPALYELSLRPLYFRSSSAEQRLEILIHELWHISPHFDGRLDPTRRHPLSDPQEAERFVARARAAVQGKVDISPLSARGWFEMPMWQNRPPSLIPPGERCRLRYDERDLFLGRVEQL